MNKLALLACAAAAGLVSAAGAAGGDDRFENRSIQGAWQVVVTVRVPAVDCTTAAPLPVGPNPFPTFNTFHEGGTMSEWGSRVPPANRSSGHGVWERLGRNQYGYRLMFHSFDASGLLQATMDITADLTLARNGNTFTGVARFVRTDLSGNALNFCATMDGERFTL